MSEKANLPNVIQDNSAVDNNEKKSAESELPYR